MAKNCNVSIIIPTYQRCASVKRAVEALINQTFPYKDFEVIVSIDGSTDGTIEMLNALDTPFKLHSIRNLNSGRSMARNRGIAKANSEILLFLDDDMEASPSLINEHYKHHMNQPRVSVLGNIPVKLNEHSSPIEIYAAEAIYIPFMEKLTQPDYICDHNDLYTGNFSIRKNVLTDVGSFNAKYSVLEDTELGMRLRSAGVKLIFEPKALANQYLEKDYEGLGLYKIEQGNAEVLFTYQYPETFDSSKLSQYNENRPKWSLCRTVLINISLRLKILADMISFYMKILEKIIYKYRPHYMNRFYELTLDYYFWYGVWLTLKNNKDSEQLVSKIKSFKRPV